MERLFRYGGAVVGRSDASESAAARTSRGHTLARRLRAGLSRARRSVRQSGCSRSPPMSASRDIRLVPIDATVTHGIAVPVVQPARRYGAASIAGAIVVLCVAALILWTAITDKAFEWPIFANYFLPHRC